MTKRRGHFIVFEGTDGSGKATQVRLLRRVLQMMDYPHQVIEFPRYTGNPYGRLIGQYLRGEFGDKDQVNSFLISLAYAGDRALAKEQIQDWLKKGNLVIADRYVPSNKAYQTAKLAEDKRREFIDWLDDLEYNINGIPREELVIFLNVPPQVSHDNVAKKKARDYVEKGAHDIHEDDVAYQKSSGDIYLDLAKDEGHWEVIECVKDGELRPAKDIHAEVMHILEKRGIMA